ncbi:[Ribosomal protein bS18]-alanine N-acetyltransferase [Stackebrandtia soli]
MTWSIERFRWWHIPDVLPIEAELFTVDAWTAAMFWSELAAGHYYRAALDGDTLVGYAGLALSDDEAWVNNIAVAGAHQRRGIGAALLRDLLDHAVDNGVGTALLEVATDNGPAQAMYEAFGFDGIAVRRNYYAATGKDALIMRARLGR